MAHDPAFQIRPTIARKRCASDIGAVRRCSGLHGRLEPPNNRIRQARTPFHCEKKIETLPQVNEVTFCKAIQRTRAKNRNKDIKMSQGILWAHRCFHWIAVVDAARIAAITGRNATKLRIATALLQHIKATRMCHFLCLFVPHDRTMLCIVRWRSHSRMIGAPPVWCFPAVLLGGSGVAKIYFATALAGRTSTRPLRLD